LFEVMLSGKSKKFIKGCDKKFSEILRETFHKLSENPVPAKDYNLKKIKGAESNRYRIRISNFRIIYRVLWNEKVVRILKIERRKDRTYKF